MYIDNFLRDPQYWVIPWILQSVAYFFVLRKIGLRKWTAVIPFLAERELSTVLFRKMRTFYRPFVIAAVFMAGAYYLGPEESTGAAYMTIAYVVYALFLVRLYYRLSKSFGKGILYTILLIIASPLFLLILGLGRSQYQPIEFRQEKDYGLFMRSAGTCAQAGRIHSLPALSSFYLTRSYLTRFMETAPSERKLIPSADGSV